MANFTEEEIQNKIEELKAAGEPTMSEWAENMNKAVVMTPLTIEMNTRLHVMELLEKEREIAESGSYSI